MLCSLPQRPRRSHCLLEIHFEKRYKTRIPFDQFLETMGASWLTLSPEGYGYHGFRHYEAMLMGSILVINRPDPALMTNLSHGENCLFFSPDKPGDLTRCVLEALKDKPHLAAWGDQLREYASYHHSRFIVGTNILELMDREAASIPISELGTNSHEA